MAGVRFYATIKKHGKAEINEASDDPDLKVGGSKNGSQSNSPETAKGLAQIFLNITYTKGVRFRYYTGLKVPIEYWSSKRQQTKTSRLYEQGSEVNGMLRRLASEAERIAAFYQNAGAKLTAEVFKREMDRFRNRGDEIESKLTFFQFFENMIQERKGNPQKYKPSSVKVYNTTFNKISEFAEEKRPKLDFEHFNHALFGEFTNFLLAKGFQPNYVHKITSTLKTFLKEADRRGVSKELVYKDDWLQVSRHDTDAIYLNSEELEILRRLDLSQNERLDRVRDLFLIGCNTGLRFSDYSHLKLANIVEIKGKPYMRVMTQKTEQKVTIPINQTVREILNKYNGVPPKGLSNQKMNDYLKELGEIAGLDNEIIIITRKGGVIKEEIFPKFELITSHTARRSFASNAYKAGIPTKSIMQITGHKTEREFFKYIKLNSDEHAVLMADNPFFD